MTRGWKIGLTIIGVIVVIVVVCLGAIGFYVYKNTAQVKEEAVAFAQQTDQAGCLKEVMSRQKQNDASPLGTIGNAAFLGVCLEKSKPTNGFCDAVPPSSDRDKSTKWVNDQCNQAGLNPATCAALMVMVQQHCEGKLRK